MPCPFVSPPHIALTGVLRWLLGRERRRPDQPDVLHCDACGSHAVCPLDWWTEDADGWMVALRCGECGDRRTLWLSNAQTARLELLLDAQLRAMRRDAEAAERASMRAEIRTFAEALRRDLIGPDDFAVAGRPGGALR